MGPCNTQTFTSQILYFQYIYYIRANDCSVLYFLWMTVLISESVFHSLWICWAYLNPRAVLSGGRADQRAVYIPFHVGWNGELRWGNMGSGGQNGIYWWPITPLKRSKSCLHFSITFFCPLIARSLLVHAGTFSVVWMIIPDKQKASGCCSILKTFSGRRSSLKCYQPYPCCNTVSHS